MLRFCTLFEIAAIQTSPLMKQRGGKKSVGLRMRFPCGAFQKSWLLCINKVIIIINHPSFQSCLCRKSTVDHPDPVANEAILQAAAAAAADQRFKTSHLSQHQASYPNTPRADRYILKTKSVGFLTNNPDSFILVHQLPGVLIHVEA